MTFCVCYWGVEELYIGLLARPVGLEPTLMSLEVTGIIQLSDRRVNKSRKIRGEGGYFISNKEMLKCLI